MARPKFKFDYEQLKGLGAMMCTQQEIATHIGCSVDTIQRDEKAKAAITEGQATGKMSLRREQFRVAQNGNVTMLIFLGKNWLKQTDRPDLTPDDNGDADVLEINYEVAEPKGNVTIKNGLPASKKK